MTTHADPQHDEERRYAVDERLIMPETRFEIIDGEVVYVAPALPPRASKHSKLSALLEAFVAAEYDAVSDMLTRTGEKGDMAPDASIYPCAPDPDTGGRQLEQLAFEVVSTETLSHSGRKAARLCERGVRRVFGIDVERGKVVEWSLATDSWEILAPDAVIDDPVLAVPLPIRDLVSAAKVDDAMARALMAKDNPVIAKALDDKYAAGKAEGKAETILTFLRARGIEVDQTGEERILATRDESTLARWTTLAATCETVDEFV